jgi:hypothetical protein
MYKMAVTIQCLIMWFCLETVRTKLLYTFKTGTIENYKPFKCFLDWNSSYRFLVVLLVSLMEQCIKIDQDHFLLSISWITSCNESNMIHNMKHNAFVRCEVLVAVTMKSSIFWDITPCSPVRVNRRVGGKCRLHLRDRKVSLPCLLPASCLFLS